MTKISRLIIAVMMLLLAGCATVETPTNVPVVAIVSARDLGNEVEATVRYAKVTTGQHEMNVGLGFTSMV